MGICRRNELTGRTLLVAGIDDGGSIACVAVVGTTPLEGPFLITEIDDGDRSIAPAVTVGTGLTVGGTMAHGPWRYDVTAASRGVRRRIPCGGCGRQDTAVVAIDNNHIGVGCGKRN
jgi:hypothetical protein